MSLLCGHAVPLHRFGIVFGHALAFVVHDAQVGLRLDETLLCGHAVPLHRFGIVFGHTLAVLVLDAQVELRLGETLALRPCGTTSPLRRRLRARPRRCRR